MTKVKTVEFETVERTVEEFECDNCGMVVGDDDVYTSLCTKGDHDHITFMDGRYEKHHLCNTCVDLENVWDIREKKDYLRERWKGIAQTSFDSGVFLISIFVACLIIAGMFVGGVVTPDGGDVGYIITEWLIGTFLAALIIIAATAMFYWFLEGT